MISYYLPNASILDAPVTVQELCTRLLNTSTDIVCAPDRIQLVSPLQLILRTLAGGAFRGGAERCRRDLHERPKAQCYPFNLKGHSFRGKNRQVLSMI